MVLSGVTIRVTDIVDVYPLGQYTVTQSHDMSLQATRGDIIIHINNTGLVTDMIDTTTGTHLALPHATPFVTGVYLADLPGVLFVVSSLHSAPVSDKLGPCREAPMQEEKCECGGASIGIKDYMAGHYEFCAVHESKGRMYANA